MTGVSSSAMQAQNSLDPESVNAFLLMEAFADEALLNAESLALPHDHNSKRKDEERQAAILRAALTQAHRANESLRDGMTALIETSAQPTFVLDREGVVTVWNRAMHHLTGISGGQAFGQSLAELFTVDALAPLREAVAEILHDGLFPGGLGSSAPRRLPEALALSPDSAPVAFTLLPVCLLSGCLDTLIVLVEPQS